MNEPLQALAEPNRRRILSLIGRGELSAGAIASEFKLTRPAISQHLGVLRSAGLVAERRDGTRRLYRVQPDALRAARDSIDELWRTSLGRLKEQAEREAGGHA